MSSTGNETLLRVLGSFKKKFEISRDTLHNMKAGFWNTVSENLDEGEVKKSFERTSSIDELKQAVKEADTSRLIKAQIPFNVLGSLQQDYSRRYLLTRRHAIACAGNQFDRIATDMRYIYTSEMNSSPPRSTNLADEEALANGA